MCGRVGHRRPHRDRSPALRLQPSSYLSPLTNEINTFDFSRRSIPFPSLAVDTCKAVKSSKDVIIALFFLSRGNDPADPLKTSPFLVLPIGSSNRY